MGRWVRWGSAGAREGAGARWLSARGSAGRGAALTRVSFLPVNDCDARTHGSPTASDTPEAIRIGERRQEVLRRLRKGGGRAAAWPK